MKIQKNERDMEKDMERHVKETERTSPIQNVLHEKLRDVHFFGPGCLLLVKRNGM